MAKSIEQLIRLATQLRWPTKQTLGKQTIGSKVQESMPAHERLPHATSIHRVILLHPIQSLVFKRIHRSTKQTKKFISTYPRYAEEQYSAQSYTMDSGGRDERSKPTHRRASVTWPSEAAQRRVIT